MTNDLLIKIMELSRRVLPSGSEIRNAKSTAKAIVNKYDCFCVHFCIFNEKNANLTEDENAQILIRPNIERTRCDLSLKRIEPSKIPVFTDTQ